MVESGVEGLHFNETLETVHFPLVYDSNPWTGYKEFKTCITYLFRYVRYVSLTQLVSTSNKRSSSGEMKKDQKRVGIYRGNGLDTCLDQR